MSKTTLILLFLFLHHPIRQAQKTQDDVMVASYFTGRPETPGYESLSFWTKDGKRAYIQYTYGKEARDLMVSWLGPDFLQGQHGFKIKIPNRPVNFIIPDGYILKFADKNGRLLKRFTWEHEELKNADDSLACTICPPDEKEAMQIVQKYFMH